LDNYPDNLRITCAWQVVCAEAELELLNSSSRERHHRNTTSLLRSYQRPSPLSCGSDLYTISFHHSITMFRTALRTSARAAGALSATSRISAVCTPLYRTGGATLAPTMAFVVLNGTRRWTGWKLEAFEQLQCTCRDTRGYESFLQGLAR
jgi:hypothetical protein